MRFYIIVLYWKKNLQQIFTDGKQQNKWNFLWSFGRRALLWGKNIHDHLVIFLISVFLRFEMDVQLMIYIANDLKIGLVEFGAPSQPLHSSPDRYETHHFSAAAGSNDTADGEPQGCQWQSRSKSNKIRPKNSCTETRIPVGKPWLNTY